MTGSLLVLVCCAAVALACKDSFDAPTNIVGGKVANVAMCGDRYNKKLTTLETAQQVCKKNKGTVATMEQFKEARANGYSSCNCAFLADGKVAYSIVGKGEAQVSGCGGYYTKINYCTTKGHGYNVHCYIPSNCGNDVVSVSNSGKFMEITKCGKKYNVKSVAEAEKLCANYQATVATTAQLQVEFDAGYGRCSCGWLADGTAGYSRTNDTPRSGCGGIIGINTCPPGKMGKWGGPGWNANCVATCTDKIEASTDIIGGKVLNIAKCGNRYVMKTTLEAQRVCAKHKGTLANMAQLTEAWKNGYSSCNCAFLADGTVAFTIVGEGREQVYGCGGYYYKVNYCTTIGHGYNVHCYVPTGISK